MVTKKKLFYDHIGASMTEAARQLPPVTVDIEKRTAQYIGVRNAIRELKAKHEAELNELQNVLDMLSGIITKFLGDNNLKSLRTTSGTAFTSVRYTASVADGEAFMNVVKAGNWDLIERRANATAVRGYIEKNKTIVPGVNLTTVQTLNVRTAAKGKTDEQSDLDG